MAKGNKNRSDFDKFTNKPAAGGTQVVTVDEPDEKEVEEPTDTVPAEELPPVSDPPDAGDGTGLGPVPVGAYRKLGEESMKATTAVEQEQILARLHPKYSNMPDPALHYKRCLTSGKSLPVFTPKKDADPLLIRTKDLLERILAGGLLSPAAYGVYNLGVDLVTDIIKATGEPDAEPRPGSADGNPEVGGREG